jgi:ribonuclease D
MHMDIELDESVDSVVIQQEQFEEVVKLAQAGVPFAPEDLIELSQLKNKDKVLERMKQRAEQAAQAAAAGPGGAEGPAGPDPRVADATAAQAASKAAQQDIKTQREQVGLMKDMQPDPKPQPGKPGGK